MKNMYLAAAMVVSLAFSACSDEESERRIALINPSKFMEISMKW